MSNSERLLRRQAPEKMTVVLTHLGHNEWTALAECMGTWVRVAGDRYGLDTAAIQAWWIQLDGIIEATGQPRKVTYCSGLKRRFGQ